MPDTHEPIIHRELWDTVQVLLKSKAKPFGSGKVGIFAGKAKCIFCGYTMRTAKSHGYYYLKCDTRHTSTNACPGGFISVRELEQGVLGELQRLLDEQFDKEAAERKIIATNNAAKKIAKLKAEKDSCEKKVAEYAQAVKNSYMDRTRGIITEEQFVDFSREFSDDKQRMEKRIAELDAEIAALEGKTRDNKTRQQIVEAYSMVEKLDRIMVEKLVDHIRVGKRDPETKKVPVEIHWNF